MNLDTLQGKWNEVMGELKVKWGRLTDDDLLEVEGEEEKLIGLLQRKYGYARDEAEREFREFISGMGRKREEP